MKLLSRKSFVRFSRRARFIKAAVIASIAISVAACTGTSTKPPVAELATAEAAIESAEAFGASRFASAELAQAVDRVDDAQKANEDEKYLVAYRLAQKATVDARLAEAVARQSESEETLDEIEEGIRTLQQEVNQQ